MRAQQNRDAQRRPKKALFQSYEAVFAEHGRDTRSDRACLRVILQLGEPQIPGELLYDKFEFVLRQLGVTLAFGEDEESPLENIGQEGRHPQDEEGSVARSQHRLEPHTPPKRRASFTSMQDVTNQHVRSSRAVHWDPAIDSNFLDTSIQLHRSRQRGIYPNESPNAKATPRRRFSDHMPTPYRHGIEKHAVGNLQLFSHPGANLHQPHSTHDCRQQQPAPEDLLARRHLDWEVAAFHNVRLRKSQRQLLRKWARRTREHIEHLHTLDMQAEAQDFVTLKRQALDFWHAALDGKRQQAREQRFFEHLSRRAGRAYDLYLLTKSLTHWAQITAGVVAETNAARQRFLFTKYFSAWHDFTASAELKIERQRQKTLFASLRRRAAQNCRDEIISVQVYKRNVVRRLFWNWFHAWCDQAAPRYREQQFQRSILIRWARKTARQHSREIDVSVHFVDRLCQKIFRTWATQARIDMAGYHEADGFRMTRLVSPVLAQWREEARLRPLEGQSRRIKDWKIARKFFSLWQLRTRMSLRANAVNARRILRRSLTVWDERLRSQAVSARCNQRLVAQSMYRWVIAQRLALMTRISERRRRGRVARLFLTAVQRKTAEIAARKKQFADSKAHSLLTSSFARWNLLKIARDSQIQAAVQYYQPRLKQDAMQAVRLRLLHQEKLERWAQDARFYFLSTRHLTHWRAVSTTHKKNREREAYGRMRRQQKMGLARKMLNAWRSKAGREEDLLERGREVYGQKIGILRAALFRDWRALAADRRHHFQQVAEHYDARVFLATPLHRLVDMATNLAELRYRAEQFYQLKMSDVCSTTIRRMGLKAFEIRRRNIDADAIHNRQWHKHRRNMIRHWASKTHHREYQNLVHDGVEPRDYGDNVIEDNAAEGRSVATVTTERPNAEVEPTDAGYGSASNEDHHSQFQQGPFTIEEFAPVERTVVARGPRPLQEAGSTRKWMSATPDQEAMPLRNDLWPPPPPPDNGLSPSPQPHPRPLPPFRSIDRSHRQIGMEENDDSGQQDRSNDNDNDHKGRDTYVPSSPPRFTAAAAATGVTPTPGYLNSPSKRAARAKALLALGHKLPKPELLTQEAVARRRDPRTHEIEMTPTMTPKPTRVMKPTTMMNAITVSRDSKLNSDMTTVTTTPLVPPPQLRLAPQALAVPATGATTVKTTTTTTTNQPRSNTPNVSAVIVPASSQQNTPSAAAAQAQAQAQAQPQPQPQLQPRSPSPSPSTTRVSPAQLQPQDSAPVRPQPQSPPDFHRRQVRPGLFPQSSFSPAIPSQIPVRAGTKPGTAHMTTAGGGALSKKKS